MSSDFTSTAKRVLGWPLVFAAYITVFAFFMQGCGWNDWVVPVDPAPNPGPVDPKPPPDDPTDPVPSGDVTEAQWATITDGMTEKQVTDAIGEPFQTFPSAGFVIWTYVIVGTNKSKFAWMLNGKVDHRTESQ